VRNTAGSPAVSLATGERDRVETIHIFRQHLLLREELPGEKPGRWRFSLVGRSRGFILIGQGDPTLQGGEELL